MVEQSSSEIVYLVIRNHRTGLYWSSQNGWGDLKDADRFDDTNFNLPMDGRWVSETIATEVE